MKILVCIKQVPDMESKFKIDGDGLWYERDELAWRMNEYDEYGVEQAVQLKEQTGGDLTVLSIGPERVKETMKKALAMGCDRGVHISDDLCHLRDSFEIGSMIAEFAKDKGFDMIFTGMQSQDRGSAQVGVIVAELLEMEGITTIVGFDYHQHRITVRRELEGGVKAVVEAPLPAVVTCQLGLNIPRYPTLPNIMKAKKKEMVTVDGDELNRVGSLQQPGAMSVPVKQGGGLYLDGQVEDIAERLLAIIKEKTSVLA
ncbi:electron transfer flavoprotein subunit beta/FixA family protein [Desulforhopalus singaporensis]|uniref:Electron transfer flavoprotein subunit beta n=1 Tax=Desulforhopalus singaporensis TaxID=91360 RepID=A0A1H0Q4U2_9BACT|nr:electron transfer flavoprotein subunit beta/FixA family protein [Desulforhopalus singaporensis]SDP12393.1 electron transfer flavoprotein beta subunit [Desulforhopalus singaporensis]